MQILNSVDATQARSGSNFRPVLLFMIAASLLTLMSIALEPGLGLPLMAFLAMVALTRQLGRKLYQDMTMPGGLKD